ncbi:hypothetical protein P691DRAFT_759057 [Macrolepiota fuliginosa MF-IS2]|uniref:Uncharacterized protein n=1 Tax=Macrolepiota fuliginosa MF-IS2 TaxID=1400762 RepID=A0A9P5XGN3_9AGAR|nr:hypothetical protein P691DRAFT_759057 [Macrolepiota fuliginosa MF-IS2]
MSDSEYTKMWNVAYQAAAKLTGGKEPTSFDGLSSLLDSYAPGVFASEFGYKYRSAPPDSLYATGIESARITSNSRLGYIPDFRIGDDLTRVIQELFQ